MLFTTRFSRSLHFSVLASLISIKKKGNNESPWLNTKVLAEDLADWKLRVI